MKQVFKPVVHVAMMGARGHYSVPRLLTQAGLLGTFYTDLYAGDKGWVLNILRLLPARFRPGIIERFLGRAHLQLPPNKVVSFDRLGLWYWCKRLNGINRRSKIHADTARAFNRKIIRYGLDGANVLYVLNGAALELIEYAKHQGILCILEQTLAPRDVVSALLREEMERWPSWEPGSQLETGDEVLARRERAEWQLADMILSGSSFVIEGLCRHRVPGERCRLVPYGIPLELYSSARQNGDQKSSPLRVLFAGEVGLRKGVPYLLEALRLLCSSNIKVKIVGQVLINEDKVKAYQKFASFLGPVPRIRMLDLYRWADILVLPSIAEGSALVTYEALASGLPVITTPNAGSPVRDGIDGLIIPVRDVEALARAIERFAKDREFLHACRNHALQERARLGLDAYWDRLAQVIEVLAEKSVCHA